MTTHALATADGSAPAAALASQANVAPADLIAAAVHLYVRARDQAAAAEREMRRAAARLAQAGLTPADADRALELMRSSAAELDARERILGDILDAVRAPGVAVELVETHDRQADQSREDRVAFARRAGFNAAVMAQEATSTGYARDTAEHGAFLDGFGDFRAVLRRVQRLWSAL